MGEAALRAPVFDVPAGPGVYFLLDNDGRSVYVGKATNLRRRLRDHGRTLRWSQVGSFAYEELDSPAAALTREADLLTALRPPWNRTHIDAYFSFVALGPRGLRLGRVGDYGCFPHLGKGAMSAPGRACIDGFDALARIVRTTRPEHELVHDFLVGRSHRLLQAPLDIDQPHIRHGIQRDRVLAGGFYEAGPLAMCRLRRRHGGRGPVTPEQFVEWIKSEVESLLVGMNPPSGGRRRSSPTNLRRTEQRP